MINTVMFITMSSVSGIVQGTQEIFIEQIDDFSQRD